jgi:hypothetical protein
MCRLPLSAAKWPVIDQEHAMPVFPGDDYTSLLPVIIVNRESLFSWRFGKERVVHL